MKNYILNAELIPNNKFKASEILDIKLLMESREDFIILYNTIAENKLINNVS